MGCRSSVDTVVASHCDSLEFESRSRFDRCLLTWRPYRPCELGMGGLEVQIGLPTESDSGSHCLVNVPPGLTWAERGIVALIISPYMFSL